MTLAQTKSAATPVRAVAAATGGTAPARSRRRRFGPWWVPWAFLAPALVLFTYFKFIPMGSAFIMSFQDVKPYLGNTWVGVSNYTEILGSSSFRNSTWNTVVLAVGQTFGSLGLGFLLALLVEGQSRKLSLIRSAAFLPVVVPLAVTAELWRIMYHPTSNGMMNTLLAVVGLGPSDFINSPDSSLASIVVMGIWRGAPYDMMIILAGLAAIDRGLYEAVTVDGANRLQRILHITLPGLRPVFSILFILAAVRGFRAFTEVFLMTNGGPNGSTEVVMTLIYKLGLEQNRMGVGSAGAVLLFLATLVLTIGVQLVRRRSKA